MAELIKILIAEDELTNSILLKRILTKAGYSVVVAENGVEALAHLEQEKFDALLTDWMMPQMDGIELIRRVREQITPIPLIIMITALVSEGARTYTLESGSDDYIAKPIDVTELLTRLKDGLDRKNQSIDTQSNSSILSREVNILPPYVAVVIATSTGGPPALIELFEEMPEDTKAVFFIVQHGPPWMIETFSQRLQRETRLKVCLALNKMPVETGSIYIAPGDRHLRIDPNTFKIILDDGPKENFVRPSADPLFRSAAEAFGKYCIGVVLSGLGRDGCQGAMQINSVNGTIIVQDPDNAVAPSMPKTIVESGIPHKIVSLDKMSKCLYDLIMPMASSLEQLNTKDKSPNI